MQNATKPFAPRCVRTAFTARVRAPPQDHRDSCSKIAAANLGRRPRHSSSLVAEELVRSYDNETENAH